VTSDVARASRAGLSAEGTAASQRVLIGGARRNPSTVVVLAGQSNERMLAALGSSLNVVLVRPESPPDAARAAEGAAGLESAARGGAPGDPRDTAELPDCMNPVSRRRKQAPAGKMRVVEYVVKVEGRRRIGETEMLESPPLGRFTGTVSESPTPCVTALPLAFPLLAHYRADVTSEVSWAATLTARPAW
jgi:hypothetical protein